MNEYYLQLKGKVNIPEPLRKGNDYHIAIKGSITGFNTEDNMNGTDSITFKFEPLTIELLTPQGLTIRASKYKQSQKMRFALKDKWIRTHEQLDFDEYYKQETDKIINEINGGD